MKNVKNKGYAGSKLSVGGTAYEGDDDGVFAMKDEHADRVLGTRGWSPSETSPQPRSGVGGVDGLRGKAAAVLDKGISAVRKGLSALEARMASVEDRVTSLESGGVEASNSGDEGEAKKEGPELDGMTKQQLLDTAVEWKVELTAEQQKMRVDDLRAHLDAAIYKTGKN